MNDYKDLSEFIETYRLILKIKYNSKQYDDLFIICQKFWFNNEINYNDFINEIQKLKEI